MFLLVSFRKFLLKSESQTAECMENVLHTGVSQGAATSHSKSITGFQQRVVSVLLDLNIFKKYSLCANAYQIKYCTHMRSWKLKTALTCQVSNYCTHMRIWKILQVMQLTFPMFFVPNSSIFFLARCTIVSIWPSSDPAMTCARK